MFQHYALSSYALTCALMIRGASVLLACLLGDRELGVEPGAELRRRGRALRCSYRAVPRRACLPLQAGRRVGVEAGRYQDPTTGPQGVRDGTGISKGLRFADSRLRFDSLAATPR